MVDRRAPEINRDGALHAGGGQEEVKTIHLSSATHRHAVSVRNMVYNLEGERGGKGFRGQGG